MCYLQFKFINGEQLKRSKCRASQNLLTLRLFIACKVKPRLVTQMELVNKTLVPGNEMEKAVGLGAVQEVVQLINAISDILNEQNASSDYMVEKKKEVGADTLR